jgi:hypothetical protein
MRYYDRPSACVGTLTTDECRGLLAGHAFGGGLGDDTSLLHAAALEQIGERAIVKGVQGIWIKKPAVIPAGYVKHAYSKKRSGWIFVVRTAGGGYSHDIATGETTFTPVAPREPGAPLGPTSVPSALPQSSDILAQEGRAGAAMSAAIMADQPGATPIVQNAAQAEMTKEMYKSELRSALQTMKLIEAALILGNIAPPVPQIPPRPPGMSAGSTIQRLEKKVEEFLIVRIPFAMKTSGGVDQNPWPRPAGGLIEPPNAPSTYPGEALSPGAGQPETGFMYAAVPYFDAAGNLVAAGTPGAMTLEQLPAVVQKTIVGSDAVLSAPGATNEFGSGRATEPPSKTLLWVGIGGAALLGAWFFLKRR